MGAGFSQFLDNQTRNKILTEVKETLLKKQGVGGKDDYLMADPEMLMDIINRSIRLLKVNYKKSLDPGAGPPPARVEPKSAGLTSHKGPPPKKTKKQAEEEERLRKEEEEEQELRRELKKDPFAHNDKLKGVGKIIDKI